MQRQYKYRAIDINKKRFTGIFIAESEEDLAAQLAKQGLYLVASKPYTGMTPSAFFTIGFGGVKISELTLFCRQFSIMINSGISILSSLEILKAQAFSSYFRKLLEIVCDDVRGGKMLSDAFDKHKNVFPAFFRSMIRIGEESGKISEVFDSLATYYEQESRMKRKIKGALAYPILLLFMTIGIVALMLLFVVPTFRRSLSDLNVEITGITKFVYDLSDFLAANWLYLLAGIVFLVLAIVAAGRTKKGRYALDWLKIRMPGVGKLNVNFITARFARCFGLLLSSGMDITDALDSVAIVFTNKDAEHRFKLATEDVRNGMNVAVAFDHYKLFPPIMLQMIAIGERTASLDDILTRSCSFFDDTVESSLNSMVSKIQPTMLIFLGVVIAFLFIAVYSPMISIMQGML